MWQPPPVLPLNGAMWEAWEAKGRFEDRRNAAAQVKAVKWISIVTLLAAAAIWSRLGPYEVVVRFIVAIGAIVSMFSSFRVRNYTLGLIFAALVVVFNPVMPVLAFSSEMQRTLVALCVVPFIASLSWGKRKQGRDA